jgi:hypothetical protein
VHTLSVDNCGVRVERFSIIDNVDIHDDEKEFNRAGANHHQIQADEVHT